MKKLIILAIFLLAWANLAFAQEIDATVTVNMEQLDPERRMHVSSMERDVMNYINNQRFTSIEWDGPKIPVDITIYLSGGNRNVFAGRLFIASRRQLLDTEEGSSIALRMLDNKWNFPYSQGANLSFNQMRFDEFTSLLDFYMMIVIGMDLDTYGELDGTIAYEQAKQVLLLGANRGADGWSTYAAPGEFTKFTLVTELTDLRYHDFRKMIFEYYVDGLDLMASDKSTALENIAETLEDMADFKHKKMVGPSALLQAFFDAKSRELAGLFEGYKNKTVFDKLIYLDPTNSMLYQDASRK